MRAGAMVALVALAGCGGSIANEASGDNGSGGPSGGATTPGSPGSAPTGGVPSAGPSPSCEVQLAVLTGATFEDLPAAPGLKTRVRAQLASGETPLGMWTWVVLFGNGQGPAVPLTAIDGAMSIVEFPTERPGNYTISASVPTTRGAICASGARLAFARSLEGRVVSYTMRVTPPPAARLPTQEMPLQLVAGFTGPRTFVLQRGEEVTIDPRDGRDAVPSYVRLGTLPSPSSWVEGHTRQAPFRAVVLPAQVYDLLVVPDPDPARDVAPIHYDAISARDINVLPSQVDAGTPVTGRLLDAAGVPIRDGRVVMRAGTLTSTVGSSDATGSFSLHVRPQKSPYDLVVSPPPDSGLPELTVPHGTDLVPADVPTAIEVRWTAAPTARLRVVVRGADGAPAAGARVRLDGMREISKAASVTTPKARGDATGGVHTSAVAGGDGGVVFPRLPRIAYAANVVPGDGDGASSVGVAAIDLTAGDVDRTIVLTPRTLVRGRLVPPPASSAARVVAIARSSDVLRPPVSAPVAADGTYQVRVDAARDVLVWFDPGPASDLPRTMIATTPVPANVLDLSDRMLSPGVRVDVTLAVDTKQPVVAGALVQVFCMPNTFGCIESTPPLVEAVTGPAGDVHLVLPDPARP